MKIRNSILMAAVCTLGLASCDKDNNDQKGTPYISSGEPTSITVSISHPTTYAADPNATSDEVDLKTVDVFIYEGINLVNHEKLSRADFDNPVNNVYTSNKKVITTTGTKTVYVGVNLPTQIRSNVLAPSTVAGLSAVNEAGVVDLTDTEGFSMFSRSPVTQTFVETTNANAPLNNTVRAEVDRLVAKVTVQKGENLADENSVSGGTVKDLEFTVRNSNRKIYAFQQKNNGVVIDPNWDASRTFASSDFEQAIKGYKTVDEFSTATLSLTPMYAPENTSEAHQERETTYASIRAIFIPNEIHDETGAVKYDYIGGAAKSFWVVYTPEGYVYYFDDYDEGYEFAGNVGGEISDKYADGYCYYNMFLNPSNGFNTLRNMYYKTTIRSILGLGNPNPEDEGDTDKPVKSNTEIDIIVDIQKWDMVEDSYVLS